MSFLISNEKPFQLYVPNPTLLKLNDVSSVVRCHKRGFMLNLLLPTLSPFLSEKNVSTFRFYFIQTIETSVLQIVRIMIVLEHFRMSPPGEPAQGTCPQSGIISRRTTNKTEFPQAFVLAFRSISYHNLFEV